MISLLIMALAAGPTLASLQAESERALVERLEVHWPPVPTEDIQNAYARLSQRPPVRQGDDLGHRAIVALSLHDRLDAGDPRRAELLEQAGDALRDRIERAPGDTHAWARLALQEFYTNGPSSAAAGALDQSLTLGPREYTALWPRLKLAAAMWPFIGEELRSRSLLQVESALELDAGPQRLAEYYSSVPNDVRARIDPFVEGHRRQGEFQAALVRLQMRAGEGGTE